MNDKRRYVRVRPSGLVPRAGKIYADPKSPVMECQVIDVSAGGACLYVAGQAPIPKRFIFLHGSVKKSSRLVWERGRKIGIQF
ncbi:pilus assembly protein PilZ [Rhodoplanes roseus]|uniref:Pilus assembly protein PilZ n=1 Tax=Rhodoplanes roseus TaxID=29409 RepID=A0A327L5G1_9BRAD|nr:pilus assembly protein PilZ [Rhodoplanes roseus]